MSLWSSVFRADAKRILRDPMLFFMVVAPLLFGIVTRWALPEIAAIYQDQFDLVAYYPLIIALLILIPAFYLGAVMALQIVDEKDENALLAVAVTPFSLSRYFTLRIFMYTAVSIPMIVFVHEVIGHVSLPTLKLWLIAVAISLQIPLLGLVVAGFANNQMEGFAVMKGTGIFGVLPLAMYFVPDYWHLLCGVLPSYWPTIAYFTATKAGGSEVFFWFSVGVAMVFQSAVIYVLYNRFENNVLGR